MKKETLRDIKTMVVSVAAGAAAFVWWSVLYPELCFPEDTYEVVYEDADTTENDVKDAEGCGKRENAKGAESDATEGVGMFSGEEIYAGLLQAGEEQVIVKSRLLEWIRQQMK